jgi:hypothetical protein
MSSGNEEDENVECILKVVSDSFRERNSSILRMN